MNLDTLLGDAFVKANSLFVSFIRTLVPTVVGTVLSFLVGLGITLPEGSEASLGSLLFVFLTSTWYIVARILEEQGLKRGISWLKKLGGFMLGIPNTPDYITASPAMEELIDEEAEKE